MSFVVIFSIVFALLFLVPFLTKRRIGIPALALAAGAILSNLWVGDLTPIVASAGVVLVKPPLESVVAAVLILLPAMLVMLASPASKSLPQRVLGSAVFAVLATVLLLEPLGSALVIEGVGQSIYDFFASNRMAIITVCLGVAVFDVLVVKIPKAHKER